MNNTCEQQAEALREYYMDNLTQVTLYAGCANLAADLGQEKWLGDSERLLDAAGGRQKVIKKWINTIRDDFDWGSGGFMYADPIIAAQMLTAYMRRNGALLPVKWKKKVEDLGLLRPTGCAWEESCPIVYNFWKIFPIPEELMTPVFEAACDMAKEMEAFQNAEVAEEEPETEEE